MKTLIAYYSHGGNNETLARHLQKKLMCDVLRIEEAKKRSWFARFVDLMLNRRPEVKYVSLPLKDYDFLIFMAPIWAAKIAPPLMSFLSNNKDSIKRYSFITVCGGAAGQKEKVTGQLKAMLGTDPVSVTDLWISSLFDGKKDVSKYKIDQHDLDLFNDRIEHFMDHYKRAQQELPVVG